MMARNRGNPVLVLGIVLFLCCGLWGWPISDGQATTLPPGFAVPASETGTAGPLSLQDGATGPELQALVAGMSDGEVRRLLIAEIAARTATGPIVATGLLTRLTDAIETLRVRFVEVFGSVTRLPEVWSTLQVRVDSFGGTGNLLFSLALVFGVSLTIKTLWRHRARAIQDHVADRNAAVGAYASLGVIVDAGIYLLFDLSGVVVFYLTAMTLILIAGTGDADARLLLATYVAAMTAVLAAKSIVEFCFPRKWAVYRLLPFNDQLTARFHGIVIGLAAIASFGFLTTEMLGIFGLQPALHQLLVILTASGFLAAFVLSVFWIRDDVRVLIGGTTAGETPHKDDILPRLAANWHLLAAGYAVLLWSLSVGSILLTGQPSATVHIGLMSLLLLLGVPAFELMIGHFLVARMGPDSPVGLAIRRAVRLFLTVGAAAIFLSLWGLRSEDLRTAGTIGWILAAALDVGVTALIGYATWTLLRAVIDSRLAAETPDPSETAATLEGEGGGAGVSRAATLLPLIRSTALAIIVVSCVYTAASSLGLNITPLLAGAGVVGIAIGFGAQALVRDIVSGLFFLIDDAFRRGEYIEIGTVKGTVEKISIRSLQLRHHNGPLHTIPFGEIAHLTNFSRDWVMMKLPLRVTYDTDVERLRKLIKGLGQELLADAELGPKFLQPLKSQGVIQMEDSAMIVRVKFMTRPGDQWTLRNKVFARIRELFAREGIQFAHREVTVRIAGHEDGRPLTETERQAATGAARAVVEGDDWMKKA